MISNLTALDRQFLTSLNRISDRSERAQRQISTGLKLTRVSDAPDQISTLLTARANFAAAQQIDSNLGRVKAEVDGGEQALQSSVELFERVRTLGAQAATDTATAAGRNTLAQEAGSVLEQLAGLASTQVEGRYIFAGDADQQSPYTMDLTLAVPASSYLGAPATRLAQHPNGTAFLLGHTAQDIFDSSVPENNVFATITTLRQAMLDNDLPAILAAMSGLTSSGEHLNNQLAFYGTIQNKVAEAHEFSSNRQVQLKTELAGMEDADLSQAILEMNQAQLQQQAALSSRAKMPRTSLFDYLG
ncbi:MAG: flagellin [Acidobacteriota bacterium]